MDQEGHKGHLFLFPVDLGQGLGGEHVGADHGIIAMFQNVLLQPVGVQGVAHIGHGVAVGGMFVQVVVALAEEPGGVFVQCHMGFADDFGNALSQKGQGIFNICLGPQKFQLGLHRFAGGIVALTGVAGQNQYFHR